MLYGVLVLGEKKGEEPYTPTDRRLLAAMASQLALAYRSVWFGERDQVERLRECPVCHNCFDSGQERCPDDCAELVRTIPVTRAFATHYVLERRIGRGGMGTVYLATDTALHRRVAIKLLSERLSYDESAIQRFEEREARAVARLQRPDIVTIHEHGNVVSKDGQRKVFLVMEFIDGVSLRTVLNEGNQIDRARLSTIMDQVLAGLSAAHRAGVLHRDIKPENVLTSTDPAGALVAKIVDSDLPKFAWIILRPLIQRPV